MTACAKTYLLMLTVLLPAVNLYAGGRPTGWGTTFSGKSTGVYAVIDRGESASYFSILLDLRGTIAGKARNPGIKTLYNIEYCFRRWNLADGAVARFFAGPGLSIGYVSDTDDYRKGYMAALYGNMGLRFSFASNVAIKLYLSGEFGFHMDMKNSYDTSMSIYKAGLKDILYPEISITYRL